LLSESNTLAYNAEKSFIRLMIFQEKSELGCQQG
jgi:hypothetical protein